LLGPGWFAPESGFRWTSGAATVRLGIPERGNKLALEGYIPTEQLKRAPRHLSITIDGIPSGEAEIRDPESAFRRVFSVPRSAAGKPAVNVVVRVRPVTQTGGRDYGAIFGRFSIIN
jgi:hypothetical protein